MIRYICLLLLFGTSLIIGCENEDFVNPLDPRNPRTSGSPAELELAPAEGQVTIRWREPGLDGIGSYHIFRRYTGTQGGFSSEPIAIVPADRTTGELYEYVDDNDGQGLQNDQGAYVYRIAYESEGEVVPDPNDPPADWPTYAVTPSNPPPPLRFGQEVVLGEPKDLQLDFFWPDYPVPGDIAAFRVYVASEAGAPLELREELSVDKQFPNPTEWFFSDLFQADQITHFYRIVAVDEVGVESDSPAFEATSPNLPPPAPSQEIGDPIQHLFSPRYDIRMRWEASTHGQREIPDLVGYRVYSTHYDIATERLIWLRRKTLPRNVFSYELQSEDPIAFEGELYYRDYYIVAYDNTPRPDGLEDESPLPPLPELVPPEGN